MWFVDNNKRDPGPVPMVDLIPIIDPGEASEALAVIRFRGAR